jgi:membrane protein implicated in regulation of membrane protease activity
LLASGVLLLSGYQDIGLRARIGAAFGFFMALAFGVSALFTAIWAGLWGGALICAVVLCFEIWLIRHWRSRRTSP